jgi:hypothetical protein
MITFAIVALYGARPFLFQGQAAIFYDKKAF